MQSREFNRATSEVASSMDISGRATAEEMNRSLRTGKERRPGRIGALTVLGPLMAAGLFVASTPMPAWADENERGGHKGIEALEAKVASLEQTVSALQSQLAAVQSNHALLLGPFVSVDPDPEIGVIGPNIIFSGANIHIVSGSGATNDNGNPTGLGNLIIGYDEDPINYFAGGPGGGIPLSPGDRGGSHNLVIGAANRFAQAAVGGLVAGQVNEINGYGACVSGGFLNTASGFLASVSGGTKNTASGVQSNVSGGGNNTACGQNASVSGGSVNIASGYVASVSGGFGNTAGGQNTVVIGGQNVTDNKDGSIAPQPPFP